MLLKCLLKMVGERHFEVIHKTSLIKGIVLLIGISCINQWAGRPALLLSLISYYLLHQKSPLMSTLPQDPRSVPPEEPEWQGNTDFYRIWI